MEPLGHGAGRRRARGQEHVSTPPGSDLCSRLIAGPAAGATRGLGAARERRARRSVSSASRGANGTCRRPGRRTGLGGAGGRRMRRISLRKARSWRARRSQLLRAGGDRSNRRSRGGDLTRAAAPGTGRSHQHRCPLRPTSSKSASLPPPLVEMPVSPLVPGLRRLAAIGFGSDRSTSQVRRW